MFDFLKKRREAEAAPPLAPPEPTPQVAPPEPQTNAWLPGGRKFDDRMPGPDNAFDLFDGLWATRGAIGRDPRIELAAAHLGQVPGRFDGMSVLELGPLEGAQSVGIERLGAESLLGIEANADAFLKCLIVKEAHGLQRTRFELGDCSTYLRGSDRRFDLIVCSGILYHMADPLDFIRLMSRATDRIFVWTHYYTPGFKGAQYAPGVEAEVEGAKATYYRLDYGNRLDGKFLGGILPSTMWMTREDIFRAFAAFGFSEVVYADDDPGHPHGAAMSFCVRRPA